MFRICSRFLKSIARIAARPAPRAEQKSAEKHPDGSASDWLPPVLGSDEWPIAIMIDRSSAWYLDRR